MKHLTPLTLLVAMLTTLAFSNFVQAGGKSGGKPRLPQGTITDVSGSSFIADMGKGKLITVVCNGNTKFLIGDKPVSPDAIQTGVKVTFQGASSNANVVQATVVTIIPAAPSKKKST